MSVTPEEEHVGTLTCNQNFTINSAEISNDTTVNQFCSQVGRRKRRW